MNRVETKGWSYSINYGPDGEENWANLTTPSGALVGNIPTHHAMEIVRGMNASTPIGEATTEEAKLRKALIAAGRYAGAGLSDEVSNEFLMLVPEEIRLVIERLRASLSRKTTGEAEPVAWQWRFKLIDGPWSDWNDGRAREWVRSGPEAREYEERPLWAAPESDDDHCPICFAHASDGGCELEKSGGTCEWTDEPREPGVRKPKYVAIHRSEDPAERLAYELSVELEQADLDRNDFVTVNRAKLLAIATRVLAATAKAEAHQ